ncbi:small membrane protein, partial [Pseudomonas aeruginosa]|nr:small membrane protein [Pseudomonas aeruginosa]
GIFLNPGYVRASHATAQNWCIAYQTNNSINIRPVVDIMENLFFLVVAAILLAVSVYFLISYLKDRKKTKLTFNKRKW